MESFVLHARLAADCHLITELPLCRALLFDDSRYPWVILVPRHNGVREIFELGPDDRRRLLDESCAVGELLMRTFDGAKLNIGALGNLVPQLHLHHVVRREDDPAWPGPVWGHSAPQPYAPMAREQRVALLRSQLVSWRPERQLKIARDQAFLVLAAKAFHAVFDSRGEAAVSDGTCIDEMQRTTST